MAALHVFLPHLLSWHWILQPEAVQDVRWRKKRCLFWKGPNLLTVAISIKCRKLYLKPFPPLDLITHICHWVMSPIRMLPSGPHPSSLWVRCRVSSRNSSLVNTLVSARCMEEDRRGGEGSPGNSWCVCHQHISSSFDVKDSMHKSHCQLQKHGNKYIFFLLK